MKPIKELLETKIFTIICECGAENKATLKNPKFRCKGCKKEIGGNQ